MPPDFDINAITADLIHRVFSDTVRSVSANVRDAVDKLLKVLKKDLSAYLAATIAKCSLIKTPIINRDSPTGLHPVWLTPA